MEKLYVCDSNVFLNNPKGLDDFIDGIIVLTSEVVDELKEISRKESDLGYNARLFCRELTKTFQATNKICIFYSEFKNDTVEESLLNACLQFKKENKRAILVSHDALLKVSSDACGIIALSPHLV